MLGLLDRATKLTSHKAKTEVFLPDTQTAGFWTIVTNKDASVRVGSRLCENASEPRTLRIVFSIAYHQQHLPVRLVSATTKSSWKSFHTGSVKKWKSRPCGGTSALPR